MEGSVDNVNLAAAKCLCFLILCAIMVSWYDNLVRYILSIKTRRQSVSLGRGVERQRKLLRCWWGVLVLSCVDVQLCSDGRSVVMYKLLL